MRRLLGWLPLPLCALLIIASFPSDIIAASFPADDAGRPAPWCSYLDDSITPSVSVICSVNKPMPQAAGAPTIATDTLGYGRAFFESNSFGTSGDQVTVPVFTDQVSLVGFTFGSPSSNLKIATSTDGGRTWGPFTTVISNCAGGVACQGILGNVVRTVSSTANYVVPFGSNTNASGTVLTSRSPFGPFTAVVITGIDNSGFRGLAVQANEVMVIGNGGGVGVACKSTTDGASFSPCVTYAVGANTAAGTLGGGTSPITSPALNIWLAFDNGGNLRRSADDGATWTTVITAASSGGPGPVVCLSGTLCLASVVNGLFRSTDAGVTWTSTTPFDGLFGGATPVGTFCNYSATVVDLVGSNTLPQTTTSTTVGGFRSTDGGISWVGVPFTGGISTFSSPPTNFSACSVSPSGARSAVNLGRGAGNQVAYYGPSFANTVQVVGANGIPIAVDGNGNMTANQGLPQATSPNAWGVVPVQGPALFNSTTTGAATTAVTVTIAAVAGQRVHVRSVEAICNTAAATATLQVTDGATLKWQALGGILNSKFEKDWQPALDSTTGNAMTITLSACTAGTGTLTVHADQF
jgi:hypothetical protein